MLFFWRKRLSKSFKFAGTPETVTDEIEISSNELGGGTIGATRGWSARKKIF